MDCDLTLLCHSYSQVMPPIVHPTYNEHQVKTKVAALAAASRSGAEAVR